MKKTVISMTLVGLAAVSAQASVIYSQDFSSAVTINTTTNFNTNRAGTGVATDLNQDEWIYRTNNGNVAYDATDDNLDLTVTNNVYSLLDLSTLANPTGGATEFTVSFEVTGFSGPNLDFFAYSGGGLDYSGSGTGDGHLFYRMGNTPINSISAQQGATMNTIFNGEEALKVTGNGTFTSGSFALADLESVGDYLFIGFNSSGTTNLTIDNLKITTVSVPEPSSTALLGLGGLALILRRRK